MNNWGKQTNEQHCSSIWMENKYTLENENAFVYERVEKFVSLTCQQKMKWKKKIPHAFHEINCAKLDTVQQQKIEKSEKFSKIFIFSLK